jgi:hypothetical protein
MSFEIRRDDLTALALGSGILGTGGGGNSYYGRLVASRIIGDSAVREVTLSVECSGRTGIEPTLSPQTEDRQFGSRKTAGPDHDKQQERIRLPLEVSLGQILAYLDQVVVRGLPNVLIMFSSVLPEVEE